MGHTLAGRGWMPDGQSPSAILPEKPDAVRRATYADEGKIFDLLVDLWRHNANGWNFPYRPEIVLARIEVGTRPDPATRSNPQDQRRGLIGLIDGPYGKLIGSVGLFIEPAVWFSDAVSLTELWLFVREDARGKERHERDLFAWARWAHAHMKADLGPDYPLPFPLLTGLMHRGSRYEAMERLWRQRSGGTKAGSLFMLD